MGVPRPREGAETDLLSPLSPLSPLYPLSPFSVPIIRPLSLSPPPVQSLDWETFEQYCTWQLFLAHNIPLETIIPILQHLKYKGELGDTLGTSRGHSRG